MVQSIHVLPCIGYRKSTDDGTLFFSVILFLYVAGVERVEDENPHHLLVLLVVVFFNHRELGVSVEEVH